MIPDVVSLHITHPFQDGYMLTNICQFLPAEDFVVFDKVISESKDLRSNTDLSVIDKFLQYFGENEEFERKKNSFYLDDLRKLLNYAVSPDEPLKNFTYKIPFTGWKLWGEQLRWTVGVENEIDKEISKIFDRNITSLNLLLKGAKLTSLLLLKHHMAARWGLWKEAMVRRCAYEQFKTKKQAEFKAGIKRISFDSITEKIQKNYKRFITTFQMPSFKKSGDTVEMGGFTLNNCQYVVRAQNEIQLHDKGKIECAINQHSGKMSDWICKHRVLIEICELYNAESHETDHSFTFSIMRCLQNQEGLVEDFCTYPVLRQKHLYVEVCPLISRTYESGDFDRKLTQRLVRIIMEIFVQNGDLQTISGYFVKDLTLVFKAAGFGLDDCDLDAACTNALIQFRNDHTNKLFPTWTGNNFEGMFRFYLNRLRERNVRFLRQGLQSWEEILASGSILNPGAAELPDFWISRPNIVQEEEPRETV